jgi:hypothetical protein
MAQAVSIRLYQWISAGGCAVIFSAKTVLGEVIAEGARFRVMRTPSGDLLTGGECSS